MNKEISKEDKDFLREHYSGKVWNIAYYLLAFDIRGEVFDYIMQDGSTVKTTSKKQVQEWMAGAMSRMEEKIPKQQLKEMRETSACCLAGERGKLSKMIHDSYQTMDERFEALSKERKVVGGKAWKESEGIYFISFWDKKPEAGYRCSCLGYQPKTQPMSRTYCMCCGGHIKHHFEVALGVKAECECVSSPLSSCGEKPCLFCLKVLEIID